MTSSLLRCTVECYAIAWSPEEHWPRLVRLWGMLRFQADQFSAIFSIIGQSLTMLRSGAGIADDALLTMGGNCVVLANRCDELGLRYSSIRAKRVRDMIASPNVERDSLLRVLQEIQDMACDELRVHVFLALQEEDAKYFEDSQFPPNVLDRFPGAAFDASEAGRCLALERSTACVFHLMRVVEYGLREIAHLVGIQGDHPNWDVVIKKIDCELKKEYKEREFKGLADVLSNVSANMHAVKTAWRNRVMHIDQKHTPEEARDIYAASIGLMRYLAGNLPDTVLPE